MFKIKLKNINHTTNEIYDSKQYRLIIFKIYFVNFVVLFPNTLILYLEITKYYRILQVLFINIGKYFRRKVNIRK